MSLIPDQPINCPSCGKKFEGPFCYACGEKQPSSNDYTLKKFFQHAVDMFTHFDGKFFRSIKYLLFFPGKLTEENLLGRKVMLMKPVQLFVVISLIYFIFMKEYDFLYSFLEHQKNSEMYESATRIAAERNITFEQYQDDYNQTTRTIGKTLTFVMIPFLALGIWLFYFRKIKLFVPHLIFATHFFSFFLVFTLIYFETVLRWFSPSALSEGAKLLGLGSGLFVIMIYLFISVKRVYKQSTMISLGKTLMLTIWLIGVLAGYRLGIAGLTLLIA